MCINIYRAKTSIQPKLPALLRHAWGVIPFTKRRYTVLLTFPRETLLSSLAHLICAYHIELVRAHAHGMQPASCIIEHSAKVDSCQFLSLFVSARTHILHTHSVCNLSQCEPILVVHLKHRSMAEKPGWTSNESFLPGCIE